MRGLKGPNGWAFKVSSLISGSPARRAAKSPCLASSRPIRGTEEGAGLRTGRWDGVPTRGV